MRPPFTVAEFFNVFSSYNAAVWPVQPVLLGLAVVALLLVRRRESWSDRGIAWVMAVLWAWMAVAYHFAHFAAINRAAVFFGLLFLVQSVLFAWWAVSGRSLRFRRPRGGDALIGWALVIYALVVYPILNRVTGHPYMGSPTFGVPCPTAIFTFGLLYFAERPFPRYLLALPIVWSVIGGSAAFSLGVPQDLGLIAAGIGGVALLFRMRRDNRVGTTAADPREPTRSESRQVR
jgi:hypothetical protein